MKTSIGKKTTIPANAKIAAGKKVSDGKMSCAQKATGSKTSKAIVKDMKAGVRNYGKN